MLNVRKRINLGEDESVKVKLKLHVPSKPEGGLLIRPTVWYSSPVSGVTIKLIDACILFKSVIKYGGEPPDIPETKDQLHAVKLQVFTHLVLG